MTFRHRSSHLRSALGFAAAALVPPAGVAPALDVALVDFKGQVEVVDDGRQWHGIHDHPGAGDTSEPPVWGGRARGLDASERSADERNGGCSMNETSWETR